MARRSRRPSSRTPADGYRFFRWSGDTSLITSGDVYAPTVKVTARLGAALTAQFVSKAGGYIEVVNVFDHPSGGASPSRRV